jgi:hypothetical protein
MKIVYKVCSLCFAHCDFPGPVKKARGARFHGHPSLFRGCKPDSVRSDESDLDGHLSAATYLEDSIPQMREEGAGHSCFRFGLAPPGVYLRAFDYSPAGGLLPHLFTLTLRSLDVGGRLFSVALSVTDPFPGRHPRFHGAGCPKVSGLSSPRQARGGRPPHLPSYCKST